MAQESVPLPDERVVRVDRDRGTIDRGVSLITSKDFPVRVKVFSVRAKKFPAPFPREFKRKSLDSHKDSAGKIY
jgi:hypothetical protein